MALTGLTGLAPLGARAGRSLLTPQEEDYIGQLAGASTSFLGAVSDVLDTLGGPIRTALAGENPLPAIFDPEKRVSGRELLERHGILGENYEGLDFGDVLGGVTEAVLDPLIVVGGGTTKAGNIAKALGKFPKRSTFDVGTGLLKQGKRVARRGTLGSILEGADDATMKLAGKLAEKRGARLEDLLDEPMQRSLGVGLPFKENAFTFDLPGAETRAKALDWLGGKIRTSAPGRYTAKMFDATVNNVGDWVGQRFSQAAHAEMDPAKRAAGAQLNRFHLGLNAAGITDQDLQTDILEGISRHPDAPKEARLSEREILDYNVQPLAGETPEALEARKTAVSQIRRDFQTSQEKLRAEREKLGLSAARFESERVDYLPREATWEGYAKADPAKRRRDALRNLGRTEVDSILKDPQLRELSQQVELDPLSPEALTQQVPGEVLDDLNRMGYEDLADLVPWQAQYMRNADPQTAALNAAAVENISIGMKPESPLSRTTALPKPQLHTERYQAAVRRVDELLGRDVADWDQAPKWLEQARQLPKLQQELEAARGTALAGDYAKSLPEQEVAVELQLNNALKAREEYAARKQLLDARDINSRAEKLVDDEVRELAAVRNEADSVPLWRARLKRIQDRIAAGEREIFPAEHISDLQAELGAAEVAAAKLAALTARAKDAKYFIKHARKVPQKAIDEGKRFYGNAAMHDATVTTADTIEETAFTRQSHKVYAANAERLNPDDVDAAKLMPWTEAVRRLGYGKTASEQANAIRAFAKELKEYSKITDDEFANIAGPHAVATSAVKQDPVLAQELRNAELGEFVQGITGEYEKRVKLLQGKFQGAELDKQLADLEDRFKVARTAGIERINAQPLTDTSHAGRLMQVKRTMHQKLYAAADEARLSGQLDDDAYQALRTEADDWLKGKTKGTTESVQEFQRLWEQAVAKDPIPNDGLLLMRNLYVPRDIVESLSRAKTFRQAPAEEGFGYWADWWRRLTKGHFTMPFASFHIRNGMNMAYQYGAAGVRDPRHGIVKGFWQPWADAWEVLQGRKVGDFDSIPAIQAMGLKGDEAERQLIAAAESYAGLKGAGDIVSEGAEPAFIPFGKKEHKWGTTAEQFTAALPGGRALNLEYLLEPLSAKHGLSRINPANVEQFAPIALGARLSNTTENVGRLATFIGLLRQGNSFEQAGALVKAMHVDYSDLTAFERNVARRFIPFWTWSRHMIPYTIRQFAEKPAGLYAQTARLARVSQQDAGFLPPQLGGSLAIPIGQEQDGTQRYLSQFDTPAESLNRLVNLGSLGDTARNVLAQTDPVLKFFVEQGTGKQLFRGRNLEDLESTTGRLASNLVGAKEPLWKATVIDNALANSPLSRYLSTLTQAGDDRKGWPAFLANTLTGLRISDQDMQKQRSIAAGQAAKELLKELGAKTHMNVSISKDDLAKLSPEARAEAEQLQAVLRSLAKKSREARKAEK